MCIAKINKPRDLCLQVSNVFPYKKEESLQELSGAAVSELKTYTSEIIRPRDLCLQVSDVFPHKKEQILQELCRAHVPNN